MTDVSQSFTPRLLPQIPPRAAMEDPESYQADLQYFQEAMGSRETFLWIQNNTPTDMANITISEVDNYDWERNRPDHNFQNVRIVARGGRRQPEDLNTWARSAPFRMPIRFSNNDEINFRCDQWDATRNYRREFALGGPNASGYFAIQYAVGNINLFVISRRPPTSDWMALLPGGAKLSSLTVPGTHDTCALYGGPAVQCQTKSLRDQLDSGVRFLDIRCRHIQDRFAIHHGAYFQNLMFGEGVRDVCVEWLSAHKSETILMSVKQEYQDADNTRSFEDTFNWYLEGYKRFWYLNDRTPTLDEVRGKIVLFRRFDRNSGASGTLGFDCSPGNWSENATFTINTPGGVTLHIQDEYKVPTLFDISAKARKVKDQLNAAIKGDSADWYINFSSGWGGGAYPDAIAKGSPGFDGVNSSLLADVVAQCAPTRYGVIPIDFPEYPDDLLLRKLISLNP